jgi:hypothetical protein
MTNIAESKILPRYSIVQYHRKGKDRKPVGVVIATRIGDEVRFGYSLCMREDRKSFSKQEALERAVEKAELGNAQVPPSMNQTYMTVYNRALKYFPEEITSELRG